MQEQFNNSSNLHLFGLQDKKTNITTMFMTAYQDKAAIDSYFQYINDIFNELKTEKERVKFLKAVHGSSIVRIADIDVLEPSTTNNFAVLVDLKDLVVDTNKNEK